MWNAVLLTVVFGIGYVCLMVVLRCLGKEMPSIRQRGTTFDRIMGIRAAAWGIGVLCAIYAVSLLYCAIWKDSISLEVFYKAWAHADAVHYRNLAEIGYRGLTENGRHLFLVFYPLYPWLVRLLHYLIPNYDLCGHLLSALAYIAGCYVLARLTTEEFGRRTCQMSLMLFSAYPFAFFFAGIYTESLFFLLSVTTFYLIRKHRYIPAGILGALAALTRMQGILLLFAGIAEYMISDKPIDRIRSRDRRSLLRDTWKKLLPLTLMPAGAGIYLWLNYAVEGDPFRFTFYQRDHWHQYFVPLPKCLSIIWEQITARGDIKLIFTIWLPEFLVFLVSFMALIYAARRMPATWTVYFLGCMLLNYSLSWPLSCGRYIACAFPLPVTAAVAFRRYPSVCYLAAVISALLQGAYLFAYLTGAPLY